MYGYGNWKDIAKHVESKSEAQVKFRRFFLHGALGYYNFLTLIFLFNNQYFIYFTLIYYFCFRSKNDTLNDLLMVQLGPIPGRKISEEKQLIIH